MPEPMLLKGEALTDHIDECIQALQFFKDHAKNSPDFVLDVHLQFITDPEYSSELSAAIQQCFGDKAVYEDMEAFEEETRFIH